MDMRDRTKSVLTLPWAVSMFGMQQMTNLMLPPTAERLGRTARAFDEVADASARHLDGWYQKAYKAGDTTQRVAVDLMMLKAPEFDSSALMRTAAEMQSSAAFQAMVKYGMPPVGWLDSLRMARADAPAAAQEFANKLQIIALVTQVHDQLGLHEGNAETLPEIVAKAAALEMFPRLWAVEGIGNYVGDHALLASGTTPVAGLLTGPANESLPPWSMTMLHAGIGMSFAKHVLKRLEPTSPADVVRAAITEFVSLCHASSRAAYVGAAIESLGLATRTLYPNLVRLIDTHLPAAAPEAQGFFWHGVGRAMYFEPLNMLPSANAPWRAILRLDEEAPHDLARRNILSGLAWAITVVNMRHPAVMETFLKHHGDLAAREDAFVNGVTSAMLMRYDTTREDAYIGPFLSHTPKDEALASVWRTVITAPCERALGHTYPELCEAQALGELFHYRPSR